MPVQLGARPQADFSNAVGMLMDCHRRIEKFLQVLKEVVSRVQGGALDEEHRQALTTALNYFQSAAPRHNEDEEHSLFPRLRASKKANVEAALSKVDQLEADHQAQEPKHARVNELGQVWLKENKLGAAEVQEFALLVDELIENYKKHIKLEDEQVFPLAKEVLSQAQLLDVGAEMKQRRHRTASVK